MIIYVAIDVAHVSGPGIKGCEGGAESEAGLGRPRGTISEMDVKTTTQKDRRCGDEGDRTVGKLAHNCSANAQRFVLSRRVEQLSQFLRHKHHNRDTRISQLNSPLNSSHFESIRHTKHPHTPPEPTGHTSTSVRPQSHTALLSTHVVQCRRTTIPLATNCLAPHAPHCSDPPGLPCHSAPRHGALLR